MGYTALLFCPDEKTARTVTQVLSELEFTVDSCIEPFAAVKKLMGQHFDAVVVDCDNEQNATLLFKSARNSASNQASLAVAVVEGQAGVAKAFRIGANLVLTKPINIEQTKGTLRVARGLLRKGDSGKTTAGTAVAEALAPVPAKPAPSRPAATPKPATPAVPATATTSRPSAAPVLKPTPSPWPAKVATASSAPAPGDEDVLEIDPGRPSSAPMGVVAEAKPAFGSGFGVMSGSGAASAPAPARGGQEHKNPEVSPAGKPVGKETPFDKSKVAALEPSSSGLPTTFTFGGANGPEQSSGGSKKILLGVAAAVVVGAALYVGLTQFSSHASQPVAAPKTSAAPVTSSPGKKPTASLSSPSTSSGSATNSQPATAPVTAPSAADVDTHSSSSEPAPSSASSSSKPLSPVLSAPSKPADATTSPEPLVIKAGKTPALPKPSAPDTPAPIVGIATAGDGAAPPNLVNDEASEPAPVLQALNISQGVSQGLLVKKVQPVYPKMAITMRVEGAVELMTTISKTGDITHLKVLSGDPMLTKAAADAVRQWKYKPYLLNGEPVEIQTQVTVNFKLPQ